VDSLLHFPEDGRNGDELNADIRREMQSVLAGKCVKPGRVLPINKLSR
jgi:hypothetical protein